MVAIFSWIAHTRARDVIASQRTGLWGICQSLSFAVPFSPFAIAFALALTSPHSYMHTFSWVCSCASGCTTVCACICTYQNIVFLFRAAKAEHLWNTIENTSDTNALSECRVRLPHIIEHDCNIFVHSAKVDENIKHTSICCCSILSSVSMRRVLPMLRLRAWLLSVSSRGECYK